MTRPMKTDTDVLEAAFKMMIPEIREWFAGNHNHVTDDEVVADLASSYAGTASSARSSYKWAKYLDNNLSWPVDLRLIQALERFDAILTRAWFVALTEWVMKTGTRFPAKEGDEIRLKTATGELSPDVLNVKAVDHVTARGFCLRWLHGKMRLVRIHAEDVVSVRHEGENVWRLVNDEPRLAQVG